VPNTSVARLELLDVTADCLDRPRQVASHAGFFGARSPSPNRRTKKGPITRYHSAGLTDDACTRTST
jgi:hypothetical protein